TRKAKPCSPCSPCSPWSRAFARDHACARLRAAARGAERCALRSVAHSCAPRSGGGARRSDRRALEVIIMLRIYEVAIAMISLLAPVAEEIEKRDVQLGRQMKQAMASVALNTAEGAGNIGGHKRQRYQSVRGSAWEIKACIDVAQA